jgi:excisionase family DNA binding protein
MSNNHPLTTGQAAEYCHVSQATIINWIRDGKLEAYTTPGGHYRITRSNLVSFLQRHGMPIDAGLRESRHRRLVLVSDRPEIKRLAQALIERNGFDISLAGNNYAASAQVAQFEPDAVVIDMSTSPDPLGFCRWVREFSERVALLMVGDPETEASARAAGAHDYVFDDALVSLEAKLEVLLQ